MTGVDLLETNARLYSINTYLVQFFNLLYHWLVTKFANSEDPVICDPQIYTKGPDKHVVVAVNNVNRFQVLLLTVARQE